MNTEGFNCMNLKYQFPNTPLFQRVSMKSQTKVLQLAVKGETLWEKTNDANDKSNN